MLYKFIRKLTDALAVIRGWIARLISGSRPRWTNARAPFGSSIRSPSLSEAEVGQTSAQPAGPRLPIDSFPVGSLGGVRDFAYSPIIVSMERRALRQIFYHLEFPFVPSEAFVALDRTHDPVEAFREFATLIGTTAEAVRDRASNAWTRMALAVDLLFELAPLRGALTEVGKAHVLEALADNSGAPSVAALKAKLELVTIAAELQRVGENLSGFADCPMVANFMKVVLETAGDPIIVEAADIEVGLDVGRRLQSALVKLERLRDEVASDLTALDEALRRGHLSDAHALWCDERRQDFEGQLAVLFMPDGANSLRDVEEIVAKCEEIRASLMTMRAHFGDDDNDDPADIAFDAFANHISVLGFSPGALPTWSEVVRRYRELAKAHNTDDPSNRETEEQAAKNKSRMQEINAARDFLKNNRDRLAS